MHFYFGIILLFTIIEWSESARILGIFIARSKSHHSVHRSIMNGLLARDHEVTEISYFAVNKTTPNYKGIMLEEFEFSAIDSFPIEEVAHQSRWETIKIISRVEMVLCDKIFNLEYVKELINSKERKIDLLIVELYFSQCFNLLAHVLDVPLVIVMAASINVELDYFSGNIQNPAVVPLRDSFYTTNMNFFQRLNNSIQYVINYLYYIYAYNREIQKIAAKCCNIELPSAEILGKTTALTIYNNHFTIINRPKYSNIVDGAGIHIKPSKKLPKELEEFIGQSPQGVLLFSFGSSIKASSIPEEKIKIIREAFSAIPQRILWRVDQPNFTEMPLNVKLVNWLPQRDILDHPNVIAFISHCGLLSTQEAIYTATPIIGIPIVFDQFQNARVLVEKGCGIYVDYQTISKDVLISAIQEIQIPIYRENMQRLSRIFKDRPIPPLDEAIYWIEYVLEHEGALHLRTAAAAMPLYQYFLLDVILFLFVAKFCTLYLLYKFYKFIIRTSRKTGSKNKIQ